MKKYYHLTITDHSGFVFVNPLTLSEAHLIAKAARENKTVLVEVKEMSVDHYKLEFGK